jgi:hypothetical protein
MSILLDRKETMNRGSIEEGFVHLMQLSLVALDTKFPPLSDNSVHGY